MTTNEQSCNLHMHRYLPPRLSPLPRLPNLPRKRLRSNRRVGRMGLLKFASGFVVGGYLGIYIQQNYHVPDIPAPQEILDKIKRISDEYKKEK